MEKRALMIAGEHVAWCLRDGMSTTDIAWSIGRRTSYPTERQVVRWVAQAWLDIQHYHDALRAAA